MPTARTARASLYSLGILLLAVSVFALSLEARAWVGSSQHHLAKHFKVNTSPGDMAAVVAPAPAVGGPEKLTAADPEPLAPREFLPGDEPCLRSHLLRSPPSYS